MPTPNYRNSQNTALKNNNPTGTESDTQTYPENNNHRSANIDKILDNMVMGRMLMPGDTVAIGLSILAPIPYLESVEKHGLEIEYIDALPRQQKNGKYELFLPQDEVIKLADRKVRLLLILKGENEPYLELAQNSMEGIQAAVRSNKDLLIIDENVSVNDSPELVIVSIPGHAHTIILNTFSLRKEAEELATNNMRLSDVGKEWLASAI